MKDTGDLSPIRRRDRYVSSDSSLYSAAAFVSISREPPAATFRCWSSLVFKHEQWRRYCAEWRYRGHLARSGNPRGRDAVRNELCEETANISGPSVRTLPSDCTASSARARYRYHTGIPRIYLPIRWRLSGAANRRAMWNACPEYGSI